MKKPNITEGEWTYRKVDQNDDLFRMRIEANEKQHIANVSFFRDEVEANAQAISAVPEMIDALIEMRKVWYNECWEFAYGETNGNEEEAKRHADNQFYIKMIDQALKKAGVEL